MLHSHPRVAEALAEALTTELFFNEGLVKKNKTWDGQGRVDTTLEVLERLEEMETDGLVERYPNKVKVTLKGQPFIRNICMAYALLLHRKASETRLFSMTI